MTHLATSKVNSITGVILAGGRSSRFGSNKAFALVNGKAMIEHVLDVFREVFGEIVVVTNTPEDAVHRDYFALKDIIPHKGPLGGIITALRYVETDAIFVTACDMPYITKDAVDKLLSCRDKRCAIVGKTTRGIEPLFAIYHKSLLPVFEACLKSEVLSVASALKNISDICHVDLEDEAMVNVNTLNNPMT